MPCIFWWLHLIGMALRSLRKALESFSSIYTSQRNRENIYNCVIFIVKAPRKWGRGIINGCWLKQIANCPGDFELSRHFIEDWSHPRDMPFIAPSHAGFGFLLNAVVSTELLCLGNSAVLMLYKTQMKKFTNFTVEKRILLIWHQVANKIFFLENL